MNLSQTEILLILHLIFIAFYLGGQIYYLTILHPVSYQFFSTNDQIRFLQNVLRRQNPVLLLGLCLVVLSGGFMITPLKGDLGVNYFAAFGMRLITKLGFFFIVFFITAYQTLGVGFKIRYMDPANGDGRQQERLDEVRLLMIVTCVLNIAFTAITIYYGMKLSG